MINKKVKVSVLMPVYGLVENIDRCLDTILSQSYDDFEVVFVMDRCSTVTREKLEIFCKEFERAQLINSELPGIAAALNAGLSRCCGAYIARMDADDEMTGERLGLQAAYLDKHQSVGLVSGLVVFNSHEASEGYRYYCEEINELVTHEEMFNYRFLESPVAHPSVMFRKELIERYGLYKEGNFPEDYELWLRWFEQGVVFGKIEVPVIVWKDSPGRASRTQPKYRKEAFDAVRTNYLIRFLSQPEFQDKRIVVAGAGKFAKQKIDQLIQAEIKIDAISDLKIRNINQIRFIPFEDLYPAEGSIVLSLVSNRGAWKHIREALQKRGFRPGIDYFASA